MDTSSPARPSDEHDLLADTSASGEFPILPDLDAETRGRIALRDRLILRVLEEEFLGFAGTHGEDGLYLVGFETDANRIWSRLGLDYRSHVIRDRVERINKLEELALGRHERIPADIRSETFQCFVASARYDWKRGKIRQRYEQRRLRAIEGTPSQEDILWQRIR